MILEEKVQRVDEVGLAIIEHIGSYVPFLHDKLVRDVKPVENEVEHVDVVSGRLSFNIDKLKGAEVPVAYNNQRVLIGIAEFIVRWE